jgi:primosomal protein N' (replication factor Y)
MMAARTILHVGLDLPGDARFDYLPPQDAALPECVIGQRVLVPWSRGSAVGVVLSQDSSTEVPEEKLRHIQSWLTDAPALTTDWLEFAHFAARYYQRGEGEAILQTLPAALRDAHRYRETEQGWESAPLKTARKRLQKRLDARAQTSAQASSSSHFELNEHQLAAIETIHRANTPVLLHGITGSGKTEVYLEAVAKAVESGRQALVLVPEINLTPQLLGRFERRFPQKLIYSLHSGLTDGERTLAWYAAATGDADILIGTRMSVFAALPRLGLIVVDEEHDASYKQQEGLRYSARDLAIWRGSKLGIPIVLGSATPSLESWSNAQLGRYQLAQLPQRAHAGARLPEIVLIDSSKEKSIEGFVPSVTQALRENLERGQQSLVFLNRRGYAPVLTCAACAWVSGCERCTANLVMHRAQGARNARLRCHHCGWDTALPRHCPTCGNADLAPLGRGTQRIEETLSGLLPGARIARIDADSTSRKGSAEKLFAQVHDSEIDVLVGTQMVAKGHDFEHVTLVVVLGADAALYSHDFRASERLFAQLMQVAGRAGRAKVPGRVLLPTRYPAHPLYAALARHDYPMYAGALLEERRESSLPPFSYQAMLRAEARTLDVALSFLTEAAQLARDHVAEDRHHDAEGAPVVHVFDPVPMSLTRLANIERAQLLVECKSRTRLQSFLKAWLESLGGRSSGRKAATGGVKWQLEVDPLDI